jgi:hypothetical protein
VRLKLTIKTDDIRRTTPRIRNHPTPRNHIMKELDFPIEKVEMRPHTLPTRPTYSPRYRPLLTAFLLILFIPIAFYRLVPPFTRVTDNVFTSLTSSLSLLHQTSTHCTKDIGNAQCCITYLAATPCLDECRKQYVDRETLRLTEEYEGCAERCLGEYDNVCRRLA